MYKKIFILMAIIGLGFMSGLFAASSPLEIATAVGIKQAEDNLLPTAIIWILVLSAIVSAIGRTPYPFIIALFGAIVVALSPDMAVAFGNYDFLGNANVSAS